GIRVFHVTGVQTCALPIFGRTLQPSPASRRRTAGGRRADASGGRRTGRRVSARIGTANVLAMAWRQMRRDLKAGDVRILLAALAERTSGVAGRTGQPGGCR